MTNLITQTTLLPTVHMEDEVVIVGVEPKIRFEHGDHCNCHYDKEEYNINQPLTRKPEYLAVKDPKGYAIAWIMKIDQSKSNCTNCGAVLT